MSDTMIARTLHQVRRRLTAVRAVETGLRWMLYGTVLAALGVGLSALAFSFLPAWYPYPWGALGIIPLAFLIGCGRRLARPYSLREAAVYLDRRAGLDERVATAWELMSQGDASELGGLVREQAVEVCGRFRPGMISYTARLQDEARYLVVALAACGAVLFVPPLRTEAYAERQAQQARTEAAREQLARFRKELAPRDLEKDGQLRDMMKKIDEAIQELESASAATPERAFVALNRLGDELARQQARNDAEKLLAEKVKEARQGKTANQAFAEGAEGDAERKALAEKMAAGQLSTEEKQAVERVAKAAARSGEASGDQELSRSAENVSQACESGQGESASLASDMERISQAAGKASERQDGEGAAARDRQMADAMNAVDEAKSKAAGSQGGGKMASSGEKGPCSTCGGSGQDAQGKDCSTCGGTGQQPGGGKQDGNQPGGGQQPCPQCGGDGKDAAGNTCTACNGSGKTSAAGQGGLADSREGGDGETNLNQPGGPGSQGNLDQVRPEKKYVEIYGAREMEHEKERVLAPSRIGEGQSAGKNTIQGGANADERARMAFGGGFSAETARLAEEALEENPIPAEMQNLVRRYFTPDGP